MSTSLPDADDELPPVTAPEVLELNRPIIMTGDPEEIIDVSGIQGKRRLFQRLAREILDRQPFEADAENEAQKLELEIIRNGSLNEDAYVLPQTIEHVEVVAKHIFPLSADEVPAESGNLPVSLEARCEGEKTNGEKCRNMAGFRTRHLGTGRCYLHGGNQEKNALKHGRYAKIEHTTIAELFEGLEQDTDWLDTKADVQMARALLIDWIKNYDEWREAFLRWNADYQKGDSPKPIKVMELGQGVEYLDRITKMVERVKKAEAMNAISRPDLSRVMTQMGRVVDTYVSDVPTRQKIAEKWLEIAV